MTIKLLVAPLVVATLASSAHAGPSCFATGENPHTKLTGEIMQSVMTEPDDGTGEPAGTKFLAFALDKPICFDYAPAEIVSVIRLYRVAQKWLGHHVEVTGNLVLDDDVDINSKASRTSIDREEPNMKNIPKIITAALLVALISAPAIAASDPAMQNWEAMPEHPDFALYLH